MTEKEIAEIRRRFRPERSGITKIHGCCVSGSGEILSRFSQSLGLMSQDESEQLLALLRRTLSGTPGKNLLDISFSTRQVLDSDEHRLLMALRDSELGDSDAVDALFQKLIDTVAFENEGTYLILLAHETYDVPFRSKDGDDQADAGDQVYSYFLCSVCPMKLTKTALSYLAHENLFQNLGADWVIAPPAMGFLFPAFDDRAANIYEALYYTKDAADNHPDVIRALFHVEPPMPAESQKQAFRGILSDALEDACDSGTVLAVQDQLCGIIEEHKINKVDEPLIITRDTVSNVLHNSGVEESHIARFERRYDETFGSEAELPPRNLVDLRQHEIVTPDVTIKVAPERSDLISTRRIDGTPYILIRADEGVVVNGVDIQIN